MGHNQTRSDEIDEIWDTVNDTVIQCVEENSPSDEMLARYLGKDVANQYRVCHIRLK